MEAPKFPKRWSREKRKRERARWIEKEVARINYEIAMRVWAKFPEIIAEQIKVFMNLPPCGIYEKLES